MAAPKKAPDYLHKTLDNAYSQGYKDGYKDGYSKCTTDHNPAISDGTRKGSSECAKQLAKRK